MKLITGNVNLEEHVLSYLEIGNQIYLKQLSKAYYKIISEMKHLQYFHKAKLCCIPQSFVTNKEFLQKHKYILGNSKNFFDRACEFGTYEYLLWSLEKFIPPTKRKKALFSFEKYKNKQLLLQVVQNNIIHSRNSPYRICKYSEFDPIRCGVCNEYLRDLIIHSDIEIVKLLDQHYESYFSNVENFVNTISAKDIHVILYLFEKYKSQYEMDLKNEQKKENCQSTLEHMFRYARQYEVNAFIYVHRFLIALYEFYNKYPMFGELCKLFFSLCNVSSSNQMNAFHMYFTNDEISSYTARYTFKYNTPQQIFLKAIEYNHIPTIVKLNPLITKTNTFDGIDPVMLALKNLSYEQNKHLIYKKCAFTLNHVIRIASKQNTPIDYTNPKYTEYALENASIHIAVHLTTLGFSMCTITNELMLKYYKNLQDIASTEISCSYLMNMYMVVFKYLPSDFVFDIPVEPSYRINPIWNTHDLKHSVLCRIIIAFLETHNKKYRIVNYIGECQLPPIKYRYRLNFSDVNNKRKHSNDFSHDNEIEAQPKKAK